MQQTITVAAIVIAAFVAGVFVGRGTVETRPMSAGAAPPAAATPFPGGGAMPPAPPMAEPGLAPPVGDTERVSGKIAEVIQVPNFTYLRLTSASGDVWVATSENQGAAVGQQVTIGNATLMENFPSKTLNRTFAQIWFGELER